MQGACSVSVQPTWLNHLKQFTSPDGDPPNATYADMNEFIMSMYSSSDYRVARMMSLSTLLNHLI